jgi:hypothetical protein
VFDELNEILFSQLTVVKIIFLLKSENSDLLVKSVEFFSTILKDPMKFQSRVKRAMKEHQGRIKSSNIMA